MLLCLVAMATVLILYLSYFFALYHILQSPEMIRVSEKTCFVPHQCFIYQGWEFSGKSGYSQSEILFAIWVTIDNKKIYIHWKKKKKKIQDACVGLTTITIIQLSFKKSHPWTCLIPLFVWVDLIISSLLSLTCTDLELRH